MGDFRKNPKNPFEIPVPNKIRKRIAMHKKSKPELLVSVSKLISRAKTLLLPKEAATPKRGSLWSRFTNRIKKFLR